MKTNHQQTNLNILDDSEDLTPKQQKKLHKSAQKNQYKIEKLQAKKELNKAKEVISKGNKLFKWKNFFTRWFFVGLSLILASVIIAMTSDLFATKGMYSPVLVVNIIASILSSVGIAFLIGSVFDFSKNSESFIEFVSDILTDIVISKKFLSLLTATGKKDALEMILKPTNEQRDQYSNINEYYKKKIDDSMRMFDTEFKTDLILNIEARIDKNEGFVYCESLLTYTMYKYKNKFSPIIVSYEKEGSETRGLKIITDGGEKEILPQYVKQTEEISGGVTQQTYTYNVPKEFSKYDKITVQRKMYEPGWSHWINYCWASLTPYESVACHLQCFDNLTIKDFMIYDHKAYYHTEISEDRTSMDITSSQWLDPDTGFYITISSTEPDKRGHRGNKPTTPRSKPKNLKK